MILSFRTDRLGQTMQTHIRLLLIRVYTVCNSLCIFWSHFSMVDPHCSDFRIINSTILGVQNFTKFMVISSTKLNGKLV